MPPHASAHRTNTPSRLAWRRFAAHRTTVHALGLLAVLLLAGLLEPLMNGRYQGDPLLRTLGAAPESLGFALLAGGTGGIAGLAWGAVAAILAHGPGAAAGRALVALARGLNTLPLLLLPLFAGSLGGGDPGVLALAVGAVTAPAVAVAARRAVLVTMRRESLVAAEAGGLSPLQILVRHRLPGLAGPFLLAAWPALPAALAAETLAGLLGLGMPPEAATWGTVLGAAIGDPGTPLLIAMAAPAAAMAALHAVGGGLRRALSEGGR